MLPLGGGGGGGLAGQGGNLDHSGVEVFVASGGEMVVNKTVGVA